MAAGLLAVVSAAFCIYGLLLLLKGDFIFEYALIEFVLPILSLASIAIGAVALWVLLPRTKVLGLVLILVGIVLLYQRSLDPVLNQTP